MTSYQLFITTTLLLYTLLLIGGLATTREQKLDKGDVFLIVLILINLVWGSIVLAKSF